MPTPIYCVHCDQQIVRDHHATWPGSTRYIHVDSNTFLCDPLEKSNENYAEAIIAWVGK